MFSMNLKYMVAGKEVSREEFTQSMSRRVAAATAEKLAAQFRDIKCPVHNEEPLVVVEAEPPGVKVAKGCCDELDALVKQHAEAIGVKPRTTEDAAEG